MFALNKRVVIPGVMLLLAFQLAAGEKTRELKIIKKFPSKEQMDKHDFAIGMGVRFDITYKALFFCAHTEHTIYKFDLDGNFLKKIGRFGQGPGDLNRPVKVYVYKDDLFVSDNSNNRFQVFSLDGQYREQIRLINPMADFLVIEDKIFLLMYNPVGTYDREKAVIFGIFDRKGELLKKISGGFTSKYDQVKYDNSSTLRSKGRFIHCLQRYGTTYRIYNIDGQLVREFNLEIDPFKDKEYKKLKYFYAFPTFCIHDEKIYTGLAAKGKVLVYSFDKNGRFLHKYESRQDKNNVYDIMDMRTVKKGGKLYLYLLLVLPEVEFLVAEL